MKKIIFSLIIFVLIAGCGNKDKRPDQIENSGQAVVDSVNAAKNRQRTVDSIKYATESRELKDKEVITSTTVAAPAHKHHQQHEKGKTAEPTVSTDKHPTSGSTASTPGASTVQSQPQPAPADNTTVATTEEKKKKGLNNAAKGAIIGLGTGAAAGAVLGKDNRAKGAVIGGVIGAIGGAVGGAVIDKNKAKKEAKKDTVNKEEKK